MAVSPDKYNCCGCSACHSSCPHTAISMNADSLGFKYPIVDFKKCTECGVCERVCQFNKEYKRYDNFEVPKAYLLRLINENQLRRSQSGGAFYALASSFIEQGGIVYGASFNDKWQVGHAKVDNESDLESLRMSKYVQSDISGKFNEIRNLLSSRKKVLFAGTPCQVAAIKSFIPTKLHKDLCCIDIICHSVPSPQIWEDYISYLESKYKSKISKACFRDKRFGWHGAIESFKFKNGKEIFRKTNNTLYFNNLSVRESCSNCPYTNIKRVGDITLGDFWGLPKDSIYEDGLGVSLVFINSNKGIEQINRVSKSVIIEEKKVEECLQPQLAHPITLNTKRNQFICDYEVNGFEYVARHYSDIGWRYHFYNYISIVKDTIKRFLLK